MKCIFFICYKNNNKVADYLSKNHVKDRLSYLTNQEKCLECALQTLDPIYTYFPKPIYYYPKPT